MMFFKRNDKKNTLPLVEGLTFPMTMINKHLTDFLKLVGFAACITALVTIALGRSNYCTMNEGLKNTFYCPFSSFSYFVLFSFLLFFFMSGFVYNKWQIIFSKDKSFSSAIKEKEFVKDFKASGYILLYIVLWGICAIGLILLDKRIPNPDWYKELMFFMGISLCILSAIICILNFVIFQHSLNGGRFFLIKKTFLPIFDNLYKLIFWFFIYFFIFIYLLKQVVFAFADKSFPVWFNILFGEISFYFVVYSIIVVFSTALFYQEKALFGEEK